MKISVGVNVGHDAGVAVLDCTNESKERLTVYEAERFSKIKHQALFPLNTLKTVILETKGVTSLSPQNFATCCYSVGAAEKEKSFLVHRNYKDLLSSLGAKQFSILTNEGMTELSHHLCHAYSALYFAPFSKSIVIVADGIGSHGDAYKNCLNDSEEESKSNLTEKDFEAVSIYLQDEGKLTLVRKIWGRYNDHLYKDVFLNDGLGSYFAGAANYIFGSWAEAGKVMGLSAYGEEIPQPESIEKYLIKEFSTPRKLYKGKDLFDNQPEADFKRSATISKTLQTFFELYVLDIVKSIHQEFPEYKNLLLTGGCALNCLTNSKIVDLNIFDQVFVPPCPNDEGISVGAAYFKALELGFTKFKARDIEESAAYLGTRTIESSLEDETQIQRYFQNYKIEKQANPSLSAAELICAGEVIAWFQGRSECGPRALGNRSILCLPGLEGKKQFLNDHVKFREGFRPYGCSVALEDAHRYFHCPANYHMPYMSFAPKIRTQMREFLSEVTHVDDTCRIQTVSRKQNPKYYDLIKGIEAIQGHPLVLNTSLNIMGQPILETLADAANFFEKSEITKMVVGDYLISK
ncbi:MAG: hypothetical protein CME71_10520 [Halobacteriovorax sp.]|nr:hypothetical protein [Halobacteriovorax sp.]